MRLLSFMVPTASAILLAFAVACGGESASSEVDPIGGADAGTFGSTSPDQSSGAVSGFCGYDCDACDRSDDCEREQSNCVSAPAILQDRCCLTHEAIWNQQCVGG